MNESQAPGGEAARQGDRRQGDRRRTDRRTPAPWWRRPWALVGYGVLATLVLVGVLRAVGGDDAPVVAASGVAREGVSPPAIEPTPPQNTVVEDAWTSADYERLLAEGEAAVGRRVRVELFCEAIAPITLSPTRQVPAAVAALADSAQQIPVAQCKWGRQGGVRREELTLLVPPALAEAFASAPTVRDGFLTRRLVRAEVEWLGRSEALALRTGGVLRRLLPAS